MAAPLNDYYQYQVSMGFMTPEEAAAAQAQEEKTFGQDGQVHNKVGDNKTPGMVRHLNQQLANDQERNRGFNESQAALRRYAMDLVGGKYNPNLEDMYTRATAGLDRQYSQMNQERQSALAANGMAGSGFQNRAVNDMKADRARDFTNRRSDALASWTRQKTENEGKGYQMLYGLAADENRKKAADEGIKGDNGYTFNY